MYPNRKLTLIFQPHLYTRTRDFMNEFGLYIFIVTEIDLSLFVFDLQQILILTAVAGVVGGLGGKFGLYIIDVIEMVVCVFVFDFLWDTLSF